MARYLADRGFEILALNLHVNRYELDVVARKDELVIVVEVRTRSRASWTTAFGSMNGAKRRRIRIAGERLWNRSFKRDPSAERMRFDAAAVTFVNGEAVVEYVAAAF